MVLLVLELTDSPLWVGIVSALRMIAVPVLGPLAGTLADRVSRKGMLLGVQTAQFTVIALLTVSILTETVNIGYLCAAAFLMGCGWAGDYGSRRPLTLDIMGPSGVTNAMSLDSLILIASRIWGPIIGGVLIAVVGFGAAFLAVAVCYLGVVAMVAFIRHVPPVTTSSGEHVLTQLREIARFVRHNRITLGVMLGVAINSLLIWSYVPFIPVFARDIFHVGPFLTGILASADGIGGVVGILIISSLGNINYHGRIFMGGLILTTMCVMLFAVSSSYGLSFVILMLFGFFNAGFVTMEFTMVLLAAPQQMRGRAIGAMMTAMGFGPLGGLQMGVLVLLLGPSLAVGLNGAAGLFLCLLLLLLIPAMLRPTSLQNVAPSR